MGEIVNILCCLFLGFVVVSFTRAIVESVFTHSATRRQSCSEVSINAMLRPRHHILRRLASMRFIRN